MARGLGNNKCSSSVVMRSSTFLLYAVLIATQLVGARDSQSEETDEIGFFTFENSVNVVDRHEQRAKGFLQLEKDAQTNGYMNGGTTPTMGTTGTETGSGRTTESEATTTAATGTSNGPATTTGKGRSSTPKAEGRHDDKGFKLNPINGTGIGLCAVFGLGIIILVIYDRAKNKMQ